jgi:hypothetical protein
VVGSGLSPAGSDAEQGWLKAAGFAVADEANADDYWHLLPAAPSSMKTRSPTATYPGSTVEP